MELRHLKYFIAVVEQGTIGKAAASLGITQPALTKSIRNLEAALDVKLLERGPRGVLPTACGEAIFARGRSIHFQLQGLLYELQALRSGTGGTVKIGVAQSVASRLLPAATIRLLTQRPHVRFSVCSGTTDELVKLLVNGEIEFAVAPLGRQSIGNAVVEEFLFDDRPLIVVRHNHPLTRYTSLQPRQLLQCRWVLSSVGNPLRRMIEQTFASQNVPPPSPIIESDSVIYTKPVLLTTDLVGFLPRDTFAFEEKAHILTGIPFKTNVPGRPIGILRRRDETLGSFALQFIAEIKRVCRDFGYITRSNRAAERSDA